MSNEHPKQGEVWCYQEGRHYLIHEVKNDRVHLKEVTPKRHTIKQGGTDEPQYRIDFFHGDTHWEKVSPPELFHCPRCDRMVEELADYLCDKCRWG